MSGLIMYCSYLSIGYHVLYNLVQPLHWIFMNRSTGFELVV